MPYAKGTSPGLFRNHAALTQARNTWRTNVRDR